MACHLDPKTRQPTIAWTVNDARLFVLISGKNHGELFAWWRCWAHRFG